MITLIASNKGGAGKTTTATNLAVALARFGHEVCLVDADPQYSAARWHQDREKAGQRPSVTLVEKRENITQTLKSLDQKYAHVIVDVAGRNSRELITGAAAAHLLIAPHQASQLDLDTLAELQEQVTRVRDLNPELRVLAYHAMASPNPAVRNTERAEFLAFVAQYPEFVALNAISYYRKIYRDAIPEGKSVLEMGNDLAIAEVNSLVKEVYGYGD